MALSRYGGVTGNRPISEDFENINVALRNVEAESDQRKGAVDSHVGNAGVHVTAADKTNWNSKASGTQLTTHMADDERHLTTADRDKLNNIGSDIKAFSQVNNVLATGPDSKLNLKAGPGIIITTNPAAGDVTITGDGGGVPDKHGASHNIGGADEIPDLSRAITEAEEAKTAASQAEAAATEALTLAQNAESKEGAQTKVDELKSLSGASNMIKNSSGLLGFTNWTQEGTGWSNQLYYGSKPGIFYHNGGTTARLISDIITVTSSTTYTLAADMSTRGLSNATTAWVVEVCTVDQTQVIATLSGDKNSYWTRKEIPFTVPSGITQIRIRVSSVNPAEPVLKFISQIMLTEGTTSAPWNDFKSLNSLFQFANDGKTSIASAINGKGVPATGSDTFAQLATKIGQISSGTMKVFTSSLNSSYPRTQTFSNLAFKPRVCAIYGTVQTKNYFNQSNFGGVYGFLLCYLNDNNEVVTSQNQDLRITGNAAGVGMMRVDASKTVFGTNYVTINLTAETQDILTTWGIYQAVIMGY